MQDELLTAFTAGRVLYTCIKARQTATTRGSQPRFSRNSINAHINIINKKIEKKGFNNVGNAAPVNAEVVYQAIEDKIDNRIDEVVKDIEKKVNTAVKAAKKTPSGIASELAATQRRLDTIETSLRQEET
ncbi:hypothetical protein DL768_010828 [Monosporascus sp. mg162]|nr:hypothetical protein DL768_010828 [Monosporascus sp. mg162]